MSERLFNGGSLDEGYKGSVLRLANDRKGWSRKIYQLRITDCSLTISTSEQ